MSMTRKEATHILKIGSWWDCLPDDMSDADMNPLQDALDVALESLRPITREQVEKTKAVFCQPCVGDFEQDTWRCSKCFVQEFGDVRGINFCPHCGAPMTDEALEITMKRLEELRND